MAKIDSTATITNILEAELDYFFKEGKDLGNLKDRRILVSTVTQRISNYSKVTLTSVKGEVHRYRKLRPSEKSYSTQQALDL